MIRTDHALWRGDYLVDYAHLDGVGEDFDRDADLEALMGGATEVWRR
jgi:hypothetical protein